MTPRRVYLDYLEDIADAAAKVVQFTEGMTFPQFAQDTKTAYAVVRALEIIGEAARQVPSPIREQYPGLPWREMAAIRDKLVHEYFGVDLEVVWKTALEDVPNVAVQVRRILAEVGQ